MTHIQKAIYFLWKNKKKKEKEREGRRKRGAARRKHKCTKGSLPPTCRDQGRGRALAAGVETVTLSLTMEY